MRSTHDFIERMRRVPQSSTDRWRIWKKDPIWTFATRTDRVRAASEIRDLLLMAERERRRAWRTVFLYQRIVAQLVHNVPRSIDLPSSSDGGSDEFSCPRCGKPSGRFSIGRDGYVTCIDCSVADKRVVLEQPITRSRH